MNSVVDHELIFPYLLRKVTEKAALASYNWIGRGDKEGGDSAAVDAMRESLLELKLNGKVVIGEGEKDDAPQLFNGETFGNRNASAQLDIAVDPVEGTTFLADGQTNAMAVIATAPKGTMFDPGPAFYMEKFAAPAETKGKIKMEWPTAKKLKTVAELIEKDIENLTVFVLDKPRHRGLVEEIYQAGARVSLYPAGDIAGAIMAAIPDTEVDVLMGTGGTPEGIISASAIRAMGGEFLGRIDPQLATELVRVRDAGLDTKRWYERDELIGSDDVHFCATGITSGLLFSGVKRTKHHFRTETLIVTGTSKEMVSLTNWHNR
ncbi:MAG: class II fructose-bisphosphatase [SAR324 cluster bacterium]|nr:class II fructose-bisphosphatase [SAR324 cluster bacterium]MBL7034776.1 class II fructose-bisphosphatase [SAR324 cluster bacterium]